MNELRCGNFAAGGEKECTISKWMRWVGSYLRRHDAHSEGMNENCASWCSLRYLVVRSGTV